MEIVTGKGIRYVHKSYDDMILRRKLLLGAIPHVRGIEYDDYYDELTAINKVMLHMEQGVPVHHSSKAWWDGVHEMD